MVVISFINLILFVLLVVMSAVMYIKASNLNHDVNLLIEDVRLEDVKEKAMKVRNKHQKLYEAQRLPGRPELFLVYDIYEDLSIEKREQTVVNDYFMLFKDAIKVILENKSTMVSNDRVFQTIDSMKKYPFYIHVLKFAKFVTDYDKYLSKVSQKDIAVRTERMFPGFSKDAEYFVILNNGIRAHLLYFVHNAIGIYLTFPEIVNQCIKTNQC
jgi:hypothetical protein